jgi:hypothetical protein
MTTVLDSGRDTAVGGHAMTRRRFRSTHRVLACVCLALVAAGCPERTAVWIEPESTAERLVFAVGRTPGGPPLRQLSQLTVYPCADDAVHRPVWSINDVGATASPRRITYGQVPRGFAASIAAETLTPGCYRVLINGTGNQEFSVRHDGSIDVEGTVM